MEDKWVPINGFAGIYWYNTETKEVKNARNKMLKQRTDMGEPYYVLRKNGQTYTVKVRDVQYYT